MLQAVEGRNNVDSSSFPSQLRDGGFEKILKWIHLWSYPSQISLLLLSRRHPLLLLLHLYASANMIVSECKDELRLGLVMDHGPSTLFTIQLDLYTFLV